MNIWTRIFALGLLLGCSPVWAQDDGGDDGNGTDEAEATIRLMGKAEAELPDAVTKEITLPASVSEDSAAVENAAKGLETANENRERREEGLSRADEARDRGAELAEEAQQNRETRGRSGDRPEPPEPPGPPGSD